MHVQQDKTVDMEFLKWCLLQALTLQLLVGLLAHCQTSVPPEEEDELLGETNIPTAPPQLELLECPSECSCAADGSVDCAGVDLTEFPPELSDRTRRLSLQVLQVFACLFTCAQAEVTAFLFF